MTVTSVEDSAWYTSPHRFPGSTEAVFLSEDNVTAFISSKEMVIPPSMLEAPAKAACPPDFTANGHWVSREMRTATETSTPFDGLKMQ